jgi:hypothetical protein
VHFGCASFSEYVERVLGYKARTTREKLRVAEALEALPRLTEALQAGALKWCAVRELTRVATPDTECAWLEASENKTTSQLEQLVVGRDPGDRPDASTPARPRPRVLRFEVAPETFAAFREAMQRLRRSFGGSLDDDAALLSMARHVLGGPRDEGRSSYQISLNVCAACGSGAQLAGGELVPVGAEIVAMAKCDGQRIGQLLPRAANGNAVGLHDAGVADERCAVDEHCESDERRNADECSADSGSEADESPSEARTRSTVHQEPGLGADSHTRSDQAPVKPSEALQTRSSAEHERGARADQRSRSDQARAGRPSAGRRREPRLAHTPFRPHEPSRKAKPAARAPARHSRA